MFRITLKTFEGIQYVTASEYVLETGISASNIIYKSEGFTELLLDDYGKFKFVYIPETNEIKKVR